MEFHLAEKDLHSDFLPTGPVDMNLVVHAPEYMGEDLFDLCSSEEEIRKASVQMALETLAKTRTLAPYFKGTPKVILHPGAMSMQQKLDRNCLEKSLSESIHELKAATNGLENLEVLLENLPPYPWYFGGEWKGNYFMSPDEIDAFCSRHNLKICLDTSHAALFCNAKDLELSKFIETVLPHTSHVHFGDAYGLDGEGMQIGEGDIDFEKIMPAFRDFEGTWVPEIWRGHLNDGKGFLTALKRLAKLGL